MIILFSISQSLTGLASIISYKGSILTLLVITLIAIVALVILRFLIPVIIAGIIIVVLLILIFGVTSLPVHI
ncbi:MAG: hypothetical protein ACYDAJ_05340 [Nitrosotalea sp.]